MAPDWGVVDGAVHPAEELAPDWGVDGAVHPTEEFAPVVVAEAVQPVLATELGGGFHPSTLGS